jgi:hypothetical protein
MGDGRVDPAWRPRLPTAPGGDGRPAPSLERAVAASPVGRTLAAQHGGKRGLGGRAAPGSVVNRARRPMRPSSAPAAGQSMHEFRRPSKS